MNNLSDNPCGVGNYSDYPYLYFYNTSHSDGVWKTICVSECPTTGDTTIQCGTNAIITSCSDTSITIYNTYACIY